MGQVFKAQHRRMKRIVALKILPPKATNSEAAVKRFYQEVEMAARLHHPNIVTAFDAGESHGLHYLAMEYVDGRDLSSYLTKYGPLSVDQAMNCVLQACEGLEYSTWSGHHPSRHQALESAGGSQSDGQDSRHGVGGSTLPRTSRCRRAMV